MRDIKAGIILENAVRMAGFDPALMAVPVNWRMLAAMAVNAGLARIVAERFPQMRRVEYRRYRPTWTTQVEWREMQECYWNGAYWRYELAEHSSAIQSEQSSAGGTAEPGTDGSGWRRLKMEEVAAFIEWEQPWEATGMEPGGVDVNEFAYEKDPKYHPDATPVRGCRMTEMGVLLPSPAPVGVFVRFIPQPAEITFTEWDAESDYAAGDLVYVTAQKECYLATGTAERGVQPAADAAHWMPVRITSTWAKYFTLLAASEIQTAEQGRYQTQAAAESEFAELCRRFLDFGENETEMGGYC